MLLVNPDEGNPVVKGDPAKRCCNVNIFTPLGFDKPATAAKDAAAVFVFDEEAPVNPAPLKEMINT